jgi:hypothetical protein
VIQHTLASSERTTHDYSFQQSFPFLSDASTLFLQHSVSYDLTVTSDNNGGHDFVAALCYRHCCLSLRVMAESGKERDLYGLQNG